MRRHCAGVACVLTCSLLSVQGQTNFWFSETSAPWESPYWSLGILPGAVQTVSIPSPGYKAVGINWLTVANFPQSLTVSNLILSAPEGSLSTLLLNYSGSEVPLHVRNICMVGRNAVLLNLHSGLQVGENGAGEFWMYPGTFAQEGGYTAATNAITYIIGGSMNLTNAMLELADVQLGMYNQSNSSGTINLAGGLFRGSVDMRYGIFNMHGGTLEGRVTIGHIGRGEFNQFGGTNLSIITLGASSWEEDTFGIYRLYDGAVNTSSIGVGNATRRGAEFQQWKGQVRAEEISIGANDWGRGAYTLKDGELFVNSLRLGRGSLIIEGGWFISTNTLAFHGSLNPRSAQITAAGTRLYGGQMGVPNLGVGEYGSFLQAGGTNRISGGLDVFSSYSSGSPEYRLEGGLLESAETRIGALSSSYGVSPSFVQTGGTHITGAVSNSGNYIISSGTLIAPKIINTGEFVLTNSPADPVLVNALFDSRGKLRFDCKTQHLGTLQVSAASHIAFGAGAGTLSFADSSRVHWGPTTLTVQNWQGAMGGSGVQRLVFGNSHAALTPQQIQSIRFQAPAGQNALYSAKILADGEVVPAEVLQDYFTYITNNGTIAVSRYTGPGGRVIIPASWGGLPVTSIEDGTFMSRSVTEVEIPASVTNIGVSAFQGSGLKFINLPQSIVSIGELAFAGSSLTNIVLPQGLPSIGEGTFRYCYDLASAEIPGSVMSIGDEAFSWCASLSRVSLSPGVTNLGSFSFSGCAALREFLAPDTLVWIGNSCFAGCLTMTNLVLGTNVEVIGESAFKGCGELLDIEIPASVRQIGPQCFSGCGRLRSISVEPSNVMFRSIEGVLFSKDIKFLIRCPEGKEGAYSLPVGVTTIGESAFEYCRSLTGLTLADSLTNIEAYAFWWCSGVPSLHIPDSVINVGSGALSDCRGIVTATLPSKLTHIPDRMFFACTNLLAVKVPETVVEIGERAFYDCRSLVSLDLPASVRILGSYGLGLCQSLSSIEIPPGVLEIPEGFFYGCAGLTKVALPDNVQTLGASAFASCGSLGALALPTSLTALASGLFYNCTNLSSVEIPPGVQTIGGEAFQRCSNLRRVVIPANVTEVGVSAFSACDQLKEIVVGGSVKWLTDYAFAFCPQLAAVRFEGDAPIPGRYVLYASTPAVVYYLPGTVGWTSTFADKPTQPWTLPSPRIISWGPEFGTGPYGFGFTISWATNLQVVVERCDSLSSSVWIPVTTNTLTKGSSHFIDPYTIPTGSRYYRVRSL